MDRNSELSCYTELVDDVADWCRASLQELRNSVQDRIKWNEIIKEVLNSRGCGIQCSW